jgi:hypothetical protein
MRQEPHINLLKIKCCIYNKSNKIEEKLNYKTIHYTKRPPRSLETTKEVILSRRGGPLYALT